MISKDGTLAAVCSGVGVLAVAISGTAFAPLMGTAMIGIPVGAQEACELMKGNGKRIFLAAFMVAAFAVGVYCVLVRGKTQTTRLPKGTELSLVAITHGATNPCFPGGVREKLIYRLTPAKGIRVGNFKIGPVTPLVDAAHYVEDGRLAVPNKAVV